MKLTDGFRFTKKQAFWLYLPLGLISIILIILNCYSEFNIFNWISMACGILGTIYSTLVVIATWKYKFDKAPTSTGETTAGMISENPTNEIYAKDLQWLNHSIYGKKGIRTKWDKTETIKFNGVEHLMNKYLCSSCGQMYLFEQMKHNYCPLCGTEYEYESEFTPKENK